MEKILILTSELSLKNGWAKMSYYIIHGLAKEYDITVITEKGMDNSYVDGVLILPILNRFDEDWRKFPFAILDTLKIKSRLNVKSYNVVLSMIEPYIPLATMIGYHSRIMAMLVGTYSCFPFSKGINRKLNKKVLPYVERFFAISRYTAKKFLENNKYTDRVDVLSLGVDIDKYACNDISTKEDIFIFVGAVKPRKGLIYALKAFKKVYQKYPHIKFYIIGKCEESAYTKAIKNYVNMEGLNSAVIFTGPLNDQKLLKYMSKAKCHVLPSVNEGDAFEGFGLVHLEANACGIPTIGSLECGNEDVIIDGVTGFLCQQRDIGQLIECMKLIIEDRKKYLWMCKNAREHAMKMSWDKTIKGIVSRIEE